MIQIIVTCVSEVWEENKVPEKKPHWSEKLRWSSKGGILFLTTETM